MDNTPLLLDLRDINYLVARRHVLRDISLQIHCGELITIVGPNGAGKSTLVRIILGLLLPTSGTVWRSCNLNMAYVPQNFTLPTDIPMTMQRFLRDIPKHRYTKLLTDLHIQHLLKVPLQHLSGGETQRLLLARALATSANLIVLDEPAAGIDAAELPQYYRIIRNNQLASARTIVMVSHDMHFVMAESDRVLHINSAICCTGRPEDMLNYPDFLALIGNDYAGIGLFTHPSH